MLPFASKYSDIATQTVQKVSWAEPIIILPAYLPGNLGSVAKG